MTPAVLTMPMHQVQPPVAASQTLGAAAQGVDFGALLMAQPGVEPAAGAGPQPAVQAAGPEVASQPEKLPEKLAEKLPQKLPQNLAEHGAVQDIAAKPALAIQSRPLVAALPEQKQAETPPPVLAEKAAIEAPPVAELRTEITPPVAPPPHAIPALQQQAQPKPAWAAKAHTEEPPKIAVSAEAKPPVLAEAPLPVAATPFADVAAVFAKVERADPVAQVTERVLDVARGNAWLGQLASDIIAAQDSERDLTFRLMPPQLGQLDVRIETQDAGLDLRFGAQTEEATRLVAAAQSRLVEELRGQGVRVAGSEVSTSSGQQGSGFGSGFGSGSGGQRQPHTPQPDYRPHHSAKPGRFAQNGRFA